MKIVVNLLVVLLIGVLANSASADPDTFEFFKDLIEEPSTPIENLCIMYGSANRPTISYTRGLDQDEKLEVMDLFDKRGFHWLDCYIKDIPLVRFVPPETVIIIGFAIVFYTVFFIAYKILPFALIYIVCAIFIFILFWIADNIISFVLFCGSFLMQIPDYFD
jgi:type IV secretory pathway VirB6-like protein